MSCEPHVRMATATSGGVTFRSSRRSRARQRCTPIALPRGL
ncbi:MULTISPECIES: hypothetical protein [Rhodococcus]|nr:MULTISPECIES: hypothetical protein [Rhodococcus]